ncbi:MAG: glycoside hydrolase 100 family protein [Flammeovirgaceae bacterium]
MVISEGKVAYQKALELLHEVATPHGFLASKLAIDNYQRIWARDGVICGLAALLADDQDLINSFRANLTTLANHQGHLGQIPSNVHLQTNGSEVSFGGLCGRVDTIPWFIIGVCNYAHFTEDVAFAYWMRPAMEKGLQLMEAWEFNNKGLVYVPRSGDWADEYILHGYVLYDQLLRLWALTVFHQVFEDEVVERQAQQLKGLIELNYWQKTASSDRDLYHQHAMLQLEEVYSYWLPAFNPGGYQTQFDAWANALALLLNVGDEAQKESTLNYTKQLITQQRLRLLPAFWPPIDETHPDWRTLQNNHKFHFRNYPFEFHNGGTWPVINAFFGASLVKHDLQEEAKQLLFAIHEVNRKSDSGEEWGFYENFHSKTGQAIGTKYCAWSAAASIILHESLHGKVLLGM